MSSSEGGPNHSSTSVESRATDNLSVVEQPTLTSVNSLEPPVAMRHMMPLNSIGLMKNRTDVFIQYCAKGQTTTRHAGSIGKPEIRDHSLRFAIDAGRRGRPSLTITLMISPDPAVALEVSTAQDLQRMRILSLRFPTGDFDGMHSIANFAQVPAAADIQERAQATIQPGGDTATTRTIKFTTDFCEAEGFEGIGSLSTKYSPELFEIIKALQAIQLGADVKLSFMLKVKADFTEKNVFVPFAHAVNTDLPQWFPYRHPGSKRPIFDINMEGITRVGEGMYQTPDGLSLSPFAQVNAFDDDDHYVITTAVGAVREHQSQSLTQRALGNQYHKMYMVKPLVIPGKKNSMYQIYIEINSNSEEIRLPIPAEGTDYRLEIRGREDLPEREWQGTVIQPSQDELQRYGCQFDFVIYAERPKHGKLPRNVHTDFEEMALNLADGYSSVRLHEAHASVVAERSLSALRRIYNGQGPLRDVIMKRERSAQHRCPIVEGEDSIKFLDTHKTLADRWNLNEGQRRAVERVLDNTLTLIQGPPGTGKSWVIAAIIWLCVIAGNRILACAAINNTVNSLMSEIIAAMPHRVYPDLKRFPIIRLHLPRSERQHLTEIGIRAELRNLVRTGEDLRAAAQSSNSDDLAKVDRAYSFKKGGWDMPEYSLAQAIVTLAQIDAQEYQDRIDPEDVCKNFRTILRQYQETETVDQQDQAVFRLQYQMMVRRVFDLSYIVLATCNNSASADLVSAYLPDVIIIDEASRAAEIESLIPIGNNPSAKRVVLVGDHKQLAPVGPLYDENEFGLQRCLSLFERLLRLNYPSSVLTEQYRATTDIMDFYATYIYDGNLTKAADFCEHPTSQLVRRWAEREYKIKGHEAIFIDVPSGAQEAEGTSTSLHNTAEALVVVKVLHSLLIDNIDLKGDSSLPRIKPNDVGVIVLYKAQRTRILIELQRYKAQGLDQVMIQDIETSTKISTVDSFQGSERDVIITSFVITSVLALDNHTPSRFAIDDRRLCVAVSRARYGLILIGHARALNQAKGWKPSRNAPKPVITLVARYHAKRGSLAQDHTQDRDGTMVTAHQGPLPPMPPPESSTPLLPGATGNAPPVAGRWVDPPQVLRWQGRDETPEWRSGAGRGGSTQGGSGRGGSNRR